MHDRRGGLEEKRRGLVVCMGECSKRDDVPQWVAVKSFIVSMQMMHCRVDSFTGLLACSCCALMVAMRCCSRTFERPLSSSTSCKGVSMSDENCSYAHAQAVLWTGAKAPNVHQKHGCM